MKRVYNTSSDVIHLFAQRSQDDARCSNVYFDNRNKIYSYGHHYLLGEFIDNDTIMINDEGYSVTTSKHISEISYATRQYKQFFKSKTDLESVHHAVMYNKKKLSRANKPELYIRPILSLWESLNEYLVYTKAKKYKSRKEYKEIKSIVTALNDNSEDFKEKLRIADIKAKKAQAAKDKRDLKIALEEFYSYERGSFRIGNEDYLRLSKDKTMVESSQRIRVSVEAARDLYKAIQRGIDIKGRKIDYYTIISINGTLKIGCHNINMDSVHQIGKQIL